jgi:hypothetical protein
MIGKSIEPYELASKRDVTMSFALSSIFCGRILSAEEAEKVVMFLVIERKGISLGNGLQSTSPWLPFCSIILLLSELIV